MKPADLVREVAADPDLEFLAPVEGGTCESSAILVRNRSYGVVLAIPVLSILAAEDEQLMAVLRMERPAEVLDRMTRIVGYFSHVSNWNRSKKRELEDRRKGSYDVVGGQELGRSGSRGFEGLLAETRESDAMCSASEGVCDGDGTRECG